MVEQRDMAKFSLADGRIEIEGSEAFVAGQLIKLETIIAKMLTQSSLSSAGHQASGNAARMDAHRTSNLVSLDKFQNVFAMADGKVQILVTLPGGGKAGKALNVALLVTFANALNGVHQTTMDDVKTTCQSHACLDPANFSKIFKSKVGKASFTLTGSGGAQLISLTHPGKVAAEKLAISLNQ
jgi:hypothetical protein